MLNENIKENFDVEEIEDFDANEEITYLVCALGYTETDEITDCEIYLKEFDVPDEAIKFAKKVTLEDILQVAAEQSPDISKVSYFLLEVETVVPYEDEEDGDEAVDIIWETQINIM